MNYYFLICCYLVSSLCTYVGIKFLTPFKIKHLSEVATILSNAFSIIKAGTFDSFFLMTIIFITFLGLALSVMIGYQVIGSVLGQSVMKKLLLAIFSMLLFLNAAISLYLLLFLILFFIFFGVLIFLVVNYSESNHNGTVFVRRHFRNGRPVKSHTRKRPRRF
ncbi:MULTISPECIES: hypothetical protein [unclassified Bacillus (in: firmicutes)]|uniref:hypothetical protein n=1 Tax=unclassified Bacillus (in: firmicutes) TaxID=185979 RepID=UPI0008E1DE5B|nr:MULTISPECIES: hypothetical protein [unclassified Bacillus (in: firmicutes)]SFB19529.1 hypothetical protein SAMN02799634_1085 [Bacillus sp. UNCCL13]SFQ90684.1 hypothetical protein SAMN04488577_3821 [Bacillus sp. cl95]